MKRRTIILGAVGYLAHDDRNRDAHSPDAGPAAENVRVERDTREHRVASASDSARLRT